jgi:hypothetical protein
MQTIPTPALDTARLAPVPSTVGDEGTWPAPTPVLDVLQRWHDEQHDGGFALCLEQPCHAAQRA